MRPSRGGPAWLNGGYGTGAACIRGGAAADPDRDRSARLRSLRRVLPRTIDRREFLHRASLQRSAACRRWRWRRRCCRAMRWRRRSPSPTRGSRPGTVTAPVARRHLRHHARLSGAAEHAGAVPRRPRDPREPRAQSVHRRRGAPGRDRGFFAFAPDGLSPVGGYPGNDDEGRTLRKADQPNCGTRRWSTARFLKAHALSTGKLGVVGFCWGGSTTNFLAVTLGGDLQAGVPFYGAAAETPESRATATPLLIQYAENDERINTLWPAFEAALKANGVRYEMHMYPGTQHGFHNNSTPRYHEASAKLAWSGRSPSSRRTWGPWHDRQVRQPVQGHVDLDNEGFDGTPANDRWLPDERLPRCFRRARPSRS